MRGKIGKIFGALALLNALGLVGFAAWGAYSGQEIHAGAVLFLCIAFLVYVVRDLKYGFGKTLIVIDRDGTVLDAEEIRRRTI